MRWLPTVMAMALATGPAFSAPAGSAESVPSTATHVQLAQADPAAGSGDPAGAQQTVMFSARNLLGADVTAPDGRSVGTVDDLLLTGDSVIQQVIIPDGAAFGLPGKRVAMDIEGARAGPVDGANGPAMRIGMTQQAIDQAAAFDQATLEQTGDSLASSYIEREVRLASGDRQGEITDLLMDRTGSVEYAVVEFAGAPENEGGPVAVSVDKLGSAPEGQPMTLAMTPAELEAAPKLRSGTSQR